ncbi:Hypothetical protein PBC10988_17570 [Planctomycetales bacterium 10988]|nr:Hypothetical protein PBC10988_17570 [Planctomycetales bacterium 10988]
MSWQAARSLQVGASQRIPVAADSAKSFRRRSREGIILVLSTFIMVIIFAMAAFAVDLGFIVLTQAELQNAADASTLAAVIELGGQLSADDAKSAAMAEAKKVAAMNVAAGRPVTLYDADIDVGTRTKDENGYVESWGGEGPYNAVRTTPRRTNADPNAPDGRLELFFADVMYHLNNKDAYLASLTAVARAHLTPRDMVFVIDRSGSMNSDTLWPSGGSSSEVEAICKKLFGGNPDWNARESTHWNSLNYFPGYEDLYEWALDREMFDRSRNGTNLTQEQFFDQEFPADELPWGVNSNHHWRHWKWEAFCDFQWRRDSRHNNFRTYSYWGGSWSSWGNNQYRKFSLRQYVTFLTLNGYLPAFRNQSFNELRRWGSGSNDYELYPLPIQTGAWDEDDLVPSRPINLVRTAALEGITEMEEGSNLDSNFYDQLGYVSYGTKATKDYYLAKELGEVKNAAANVVGGAMSGNGLTNIQMGIKLGRQVLLDTDNNAREFTTKVLVLLSDGLPNIYDDYGNYNQYNAKVNSIYQAEQTAAAGIYIHTIALGSGADRDLMDDIAEIGRGSSFYASTSNQNDLTSIFVDIAKDRLGKFFK